MAEDAHVEEHFEDLEKQAHAARFGMWVFLASEILLFAGLFTLYAAYRQAMPHGFEVGVQHNTRILGSINTGILLCSSYAVASSVTALRRGKRGRALALLAVTIVLGLGFLAIKLTEYGMHFHDGIYPGQVGDWFHAHHEAGVAPFWTLYFLTTGLHAVHVTVGMGVLAFLAYGVLRGKVTPATHHRLEIGAIYWHLVDVIWIFVWPLYYLTPGG